MQRLANELGVATHIVRAGQLTPLEMAWCFEHCAAFVTTSRAEACPMVVSDNSEHREFLDEHSALLVNPHAPAVIADAIVSVLAAPEAAACRAQTARAQTVQWSIPTIARQYAQVYHEVLARRACSQDG